MKNGFKLIICISVVFIVSFSVFFAINNFFPSYFVLAERNFYKQDFSNEKIIALMGSSHVGMLNVTHIESELNTDGYSFSVYNLAVKGDVPEERAKTIDDLILLKPILVAYGISYRDLNVPASNPLPDPKEYFHDFISQVDVIQNPKIVTLEKIRTLQSTWFASSKEITWKNTPFMTYDPITEMQIMNDTVLKNQIFISESSKINLGNASTNKQVLFLINSINELKKHNIKVTVYATPLHRFYLEGLDQTQKDAFNSILEKITEDTGIKIYDLTQKYDDMAIWSNISHIAFNKNSLAYSEDIANIIESEIEK